MIYNYNNRNEIDKLYIHDSVFKGFLYNYAMGNKTIKFSAYNEWLKKQFNFCFNHVIFCNIQGCEFWSCNGNSILDVYTDENNGYLNELIKTQQSKPEDYKHSRLDMGMNYIQVKFEINSGDTLLIIAESLEFEEEELQ